MGNQVKADLDIMRGVAGKLANDYGQLMESISTLQRQSDVHAATWSGEAKNAWNAAMTNVNSAWSRLNSVLDEISSHVSTSNAQYQDTDATNASSISKVPTTGITSTLNR